MTPPRILDLQPGTPACLEIPDLPETNINQGSQIKYRKREFARLSAKTFLLLSEKYWIFKNCFSFTTILRIFIIIVHFRTFRIDLYAYNIFFELIFQYSLKVYRAMEKRRKRGQHKAPLKIGAVLWMVYIYVSVREIHTSKIS